MKKTVVLVRGVPGSGKSTRAKALIAEYMRGAGQSASFRHLEADMFFIQEDGEYVFNRAKLPEAHKECQKLFTQSLQSGVDLVVVSNTFVKKWEMEYYLKTAASFGYDVRIEVCTGNYQNVHGVPEEAISTMRRNFEEI